MWTKRQKLQQTASQICPGGWGWEHDPKDSKQHINTAAGHWVWRVTGGSNEKALRLETSRKEPACRPGGNLGGDVDCGHVGWKHRHGHLLPWGQVYLQPT